MDPDFLLVAGIVLAGFTIPEILSSISERTPPNMSILMVFISIALIVAAIYIKPGGYRIEEIPDVFFLLFRS